VDLAGQLNPSWHVMFIVASGQYDAAGQSASAVEFAGQWDPDWQAAMWFVVLL